MAAILITGMSGTGKSTVLAALHERGYATADLDDGWCVPQDDGTQLWDERAVTRLLDAAAEAGDAPLFVAGCEANMGAFLPRFAHVILLTAPWSTLEERLIARTTNPFGSTEAEREKVRRDQQEVEPLLERVSGTVIDTRTPVAETVTAILRECGLFGRA